MSARLLQIAAATTLMLMPGLASAADCTITVGAVLELTGPAGEYGQA
ncbi:MAG: amino acid ABC transporter substrate-binding protein, partial [Fimbriimonadaceae bacterium]